jgi:hypothetical protein
MIEDLEKRLRTGKLRLSYWQDKCAAPNPSKLELEQLKRAKENLAKLEAAKNSL